MHKSGSDRTLDRTSNNAGTQNNSNSGTPSSGGSRSRRKNGDRRKFKRSITLSSIPHEVLREAQLAVAAQGGGDRCVSPRVMGKHEMLQV